MTTSQRLLVEATDGRSIDVLVAGEGSRVLIFHDGTPSAPVEFPQLWSAADTLDLRVVCWARGGYAGSTPKPGRSVADVVADADPVLAAIGAADQPRLVLGWSGGGPHALAHAALDPQCAAVSVIAGAGPFEEMSREEWTAGMGPENQVEFDAAMQGAEVLTESLAAFAEGMANVTPDGVVEGFGGLVDEVDAAAIRQPGVAEHYAEGLRMALSAGITGWRDDTLSFVKPWGFDLRTITTPVALWQGGHDLMVPPTHATRMAELIPTAQLHTDPDEGHLSYIARLDEILADLVAIAG
jgi:pimeloyl-ACP methyl ester carboxylesterase